MPKRNAATELNHENWNVEEESEEVSTWIVHRTIHIYFFHVAYKFSRNPEFTRSPLLSSIEYCACFGFLYCLNFVFSFICVLAFFFSFFYSSLNLLLSREMYYVNSLYHHYMPCQKSLEHGIHLKCGNLHINTTLCTVLKLLVANLIFQMFAIELTFSVNMNSENMACFYFWYLWVGNNYDLSPSALTPKSFAQAGSFVLADEDVLKTRVIRKAKRTIQGDGGSGVSMRNFVVIVDFIFDRSVLCDLLRFSYNLSNIWSVKLQKIGTIEIASWKQVNIIQREENLRGNCHSK